MRFTVPDALAGERLDRALALLSGRPRSIVADAIASGVVLIGGAPATTRARRVVAGEIVDAPLEELEVELVLPGENAQVPFAIAYEDDDLIVVDKPPGVVVHPGAGHRDDTLVSGLLARYPDLGLGANDPLRPGIVHRLDKDTSGLLIVARREEVRAQLSQALAQREIARHYLALARGLVAAEEGVIEAPIGRSQRDPTRMAVRRDGRAARSFYRVLGRSDALAPLSLLEVHLDTGRTHQIRVHLQAIGHPVAGDRRYGGELGTLGLGRPFLHAARLEFVHPGSGQLIEVVSPLPEDLSAVLERAGIALPPAAPRPEEGNGF